MTALQAQPTSDAALGRSERLNWALVLLPLLVSVRLSRDIQVVCFGILLLLSVVKAPRPDPRFARYVPLLLLVVVAGGLTMPRGAPVRESVFLVLTALVIIAAVRRETADNAIRSLVAGMLLYLVGNIAGWLAGITSPAAAVRVGLFEQEGSFFSERILFPFTVSINEPAIVAAALLAYTALGRRGGRPIGVLGWLGVATAVFVIGASGSRFPAIVLVIVLAVAMPFPRLARFAPIAGLVGMAYPYFANAATPLVASVARAAGNFTFFARGQTTAQLEGASSRSDFWEAGFYFWDRVPDLSEKFIGYGFNGHVTSGAVYLYYEPGGFVNDPSALTFHNSPLQQMYNTGYLGLGAFIVALFIVARRFMVTRDPAACGMLAVLYASCALEVFMAPANRAIPFELVLALSVIAPLADKPDKATVARQKRLQM